MTATGGLPRLPGAADQTPPSVPGPPPLPSMAPPPAASMAPPPAASVPSPPPSPSVLPPSVPLPPVGSPPVALPSPPQVMGSPSPSPAFDHRPEEHAGGASASNGAAGGQSFAALRSEPPPRLFATWWLRYLLAIAQLVGIAVVLLREYAEPGGMDAMIVVIPHVMAAVMLVGWSALAMLDAARLVPATRYRRPSRAWVAIVLWIGAMAAPVAAFEVVDELRERFEDESDDLVAVALGVVALLVCFVLVWFPFRYHVRQAHRIGAPGSVVAAWFWLPLLTAVGVLAVMALGLRDVLADGGFTDLERMAQVAVLYGLPALMFAMSTWRATTVFDEVIELRWMRWRTEWEQTLVALAAQPAPGPEASPVIGYRSH